MHRNLGRLVLAVATLSYSLISIGQEGATLEEVVVTAQKRAENVQDVPIAITAVDSEFLRDSSIDSVKDMFLYVPGLSGRSASETESVFSIRGIGTNAFSASSDASVAVFVDEIYQGHPIIAGPPFFDVERIEVVKGPQGTLFGRNTSAGAISIITKKADRQEMYLDGQLAAGNKGQQEIKAVGNFSNSDTQGVRLGMRAWQRDGSLENTAGQELNKEDSIFARLSWDADWSDIVSTALLVDYYTSEATYGLIEFDPANRDAALENATVTQGEPPSLNVDSDNLRAGFRVEVDLSDSIMLTSLTSFVNAELVAIPFDADSTELNILQFHEPWDFDYISQDLRINGNTESTDWFIGLNVRDEDVSANTELEYNDEDVFLALLGDTCTNLSPDLMLPPGSCITSAVEPSIAKADNFSWSVYGDVAWHFSDKGTLTLGGRYSFDDKEITLDTPFANTATSLALGDNLLEPSTLTPITNQNDWTDFSPRLAVNYAVTDEVNLYGSVGAGYKAGGFNSAPDISIGNLMPGQTQTPLGFEPEQSIAYEFGVKSLLGGGRARVNAAAFFIDYEDYQLESVVGLNFLITNVADAENIGLELETNVLLTDYLQLIFNYSYIDSEIKSGSVQSDAALPPVDVTGQRLPYAPENSLTLILDWTSPITDSLELQLRGELASQDEIFFQLPNDDISLQRDRDVVNVRLGLGSVDGKWDVSIVGENVTDERWFETTGLVLTPLGVPNIGDLWRGEVRYRFGGS